MTPRLLLLYLPGEIRKSIWDYALQTRIVHVLNNFTVECAGADNIVCSGIECKGKPAHRGQQSLTCTHVTVHEWTTSCRQIYRETVRLRMERTIISFTSVGALYRLSLVSTYTFKQLYSVYINLGPAKYGRRSDMKKAEEALYTLSQEAIYLQDLNLYVSYYGGAETDKVVLSTHIIQEILRFRNLESFHLRIMRLPPGPLGPAYDPKLVAQIFQRLEVLETVLKKFVCNQPCKTYRKKEEHPTSKMIEEQCCKDVDYLEDYVSRQNT